MLKKHKRMKQFRHKQQELEEESEMESVHVEGEE
jgi:hypothetical protein